MRRLLLVVALLTLSCSTAWGRPPEKTPSNVLAGVQKHAAAMGWKVTCTDVYGAITCGFYDPAQSGVMLVRGKMVRAEGRVLLTRLQPAPACRYRVVVQAAVASTLVANVCTPGWVSRVWP